MRLLQFLELEQPHITAETLIILKDLLRRHPKHTLDINAALEQVDIMAVEEPAAKAVRRGHPIAAASDRCGPVTVRSPRSLPPAGSQPSDRHPPPPSHPGSRTEDAGPVDPSVAAN